MNRQIFQFSRHSDTISFRLYQLMPGLPATGRWLSIFVFLAMAILYPERPA